jgi:integrase
MRVNLKRLHAVKPKRGKDVYYYAWRGGPRVVTDAEPGTPEFMQVYNSAVGTTKQPAAGSVANLIFFYKESTEFTGRRDRTKRDYLKHIAVIEKKFGSMPISALDDRRARGVFKEWRDKLAKKSLRQADYAWTVLQRIFSVAKDRGKITANPCEKGGRLYHADRTDLIWTDNDVATFLEKAPAHLHLPLMLALWTGQRQGDLLRLPWSAYDGAFIRLRQSKGGARVKIPVGAPLKVMLDSTKRVATVILTTSRKTKKAWTSGGFGHVFGVASDRAGIEGLTFHDLRGSAVTRLFTAGATVGEIASITGHSLADVEAILEAHYFGRTTELAASGMAKLERAATAASADKK